MAKKIVSPDSTKGLPLAIVQQMITLSTSGFGLVSALAWNQVVQIFVESYIKPYLPAGSQFVSLLIYAVIVTILAVVVTLQLTRIQQQLVIIKENKKPKKTA